jgi:integrase
MKTRYELNRDFVRSLKPNGKQQEFVDRTIAGFSIRMTPIGGISYTLRYRRPDGSFARKKIGNWPELSPADARRIVERELQMTERKGDSAAVVAERRARRDAAAKRNATLPTVREFLTNHYEDWLLTHRKGGAALAKLIRNHFADLLDKPLDAVSVWDLNVWKVACRKKGNTEATVARKLTALQGLYSHAIDDAELLSVNPVTQVMKKTNAASNEIVRYLDDDERARLYAALIEREDEQRDMRDRYNAHRRMRKYKPYPSLRGVAFTDYLRPAVIVSLNTGLRRGELFALQWSDVNLDGPAPMITVQRGNAKGDKVRRIPLNAEALETLKTWKPLADGLFVFANPATGAPMTDIKKPWEALLARAQISNFRWHDLRHDFASRLVMAGVDLNRVRDLLGHADLKMTLRYAHLAPEHLADAVSVLKPPSAKRQRDAMKLAA